MEDISIYSVVTALNKSGVLLDGKNVPACIFFKYSHHQARASGSRNMQKNVLLVL